jgi:hypothetical protein
MTGIEYTNLPVSASVGDPEVGRLRAEIERLRAALDSVRYEARNGMMPGNLPRLADMCDKALNEQLVHDEK